MAIVGLAARIIGAEADAWMRPWFWIVIVSGLGLFFGLPAWSVAGIFWRLLTDKEYGDG